MQLDLTRPTSQVSRLSAADWYARFVRQSISYFYAEEEGLGALQTILNLSAPAKCTNIVVRVPDEVCVLDDERTVAPGVIATSPVQTTSIS